MKQTWLSLTEALCFQVVCLSYSCKHKISQEHGRNLFKFCTTLHSRMVVRGQRSRSVWPNVCPTLVTMITQGHFEAQMSTWSQRMTWLDFWSKQIFSHNSRINTQIIADLYYMNKMMNWWHVLSRKRTLWHLVFEGSPLCRRVERVYEASMFKNL